VVLGWLGDCRAYWFGTDYRLITKDHSWINEVVDAGRLSYEEAIHRRGAHAVTRSLGGPSYRDDESDQPSLLGVNLKGPGWLLLCSDGLWNYAPDPAEMASWVLDALNAGKGEALKMAQTLVEHGRAKGGKDNLTALLMHIK
jgi:serine/threonine protein phosphatase PrpC